MAKKPSEAFAMSDEDEFFDTSENSGEEGGEDGSDTSDGSDGAGEETNDSNNRSEGSGGDEEGSSGDGSEDSGEDGGAEGSGDEGEGSEDGEGEGSEGDETSGSESGGKQGSGKAGEGEEGDDEEGEGEASGDFDFFGDEGEGDGEEDKPSTAISFKEIGNALEIELENDTKEEFTEKVKSRIEAAKQEVKLDEFDPEARRLVDHLNKNGGKLGNFFVNPAIVNLQNVLSMDAEDKVRMVRRTELSKDGNATQEEINKQIDEELSGMTAMQIVNTANQVDQNANKLIASEIDKIVGESEKVAKERQVQEQQRVEKSREDLKNFVHKQDDFLGLKLSDKAKSRIVKDIETGRFDKVVDLTDAEVRLAAYMIKQTGGKIKEQFTKRLAESSREGYNKATDKHTSKLHKNKEGAKASSSGHQEASKGQKNFDNWGEMDL
jgi:hypothetical protein